MNKIKKLKIGVSRCLLGEKVRYDGTDKANRYLEDLTEQFELVSICPEMAAGMSVPRLPIHVVDCDGDLRLLERDDHSKDHAEAFAEMLKREIPQLVEIVGYVGVKSSPSCGPQNLKVFDKSGDILHRNGEGLFIAALRQAYPSLPIIEDEELYDMKKRNDFVQKVLAYASSSTHKTTQNIVSLREGFRQKL